jgi:hypothetical protein
VRGPIGYTGTRHHAVLPCLEVAVTRRPAAVLGLLSAVSLVLTVVLATQPAAAALPNGLALSHDTPVKMR